MTRAKVTILSVSALVIATLAFAVYQSLPARNVPPSPTQSAGLILGKADAPVQIEVFEDFQCPACVRFSLNVEPSVIRELVETGKASYVFRNYPFLDGGDPQGESRRAAEASMCAAEQNQFWEYKSALVANWAGENGGAFSDANLSRFAQSLNLNMEAFNACFQESRYSELIEADLQRGKQLGVSGTPSVFVNGKPVSPGFIPSLEEIQAAVEAAQP